MEGKASRFAVLIPLNSGLVFTLLRRFMPFRCASLNPFEFRAGIYLAEHAGWDVIVGLNPFEFRAGIYLQD